MKSLLFILISLLPLSAEPTLRSVGEIVGPDGILEEVLPIPSDLAPSDSLEADFGYSVSLWEDLIAVGTPFDEDFGAGNPGRVYIYALTEAGWEIRQKLEPHDVEGRMRFGQAVDFSENGEWLAVGTNDSQQSGLNQVPGGCYLYQKNSRTGLFEFHQKIASRESRNRFGFDLRISENWLAILDDSEDEVVMHQWDPALNCWVERQVLKPQSNREIVNSRRAMDLSGPHFAFLQVLNFQEEAEVFHFDDFQQRWVLEQTFSLYNSWSIDLGVNLDGDRMTLPVSYTPTGQTYARTRHEVFERTGATGVAEPNGDVWERLDDDFGIVGGDSVPPPSLSGNEIFWAFVPDIYSPERDLKMAFFDEQSGSWSDPIELGEIGDNAELGDASSEIMVFRSFDYDLWVPKVQVVRPSQSDLVQSIRRKLFYDEGLTAAEKNEAAFAYERRLFATNPDPDPEVLKDSFVTRHSQISTYYGEVNQENAEEADLLLRELYRTSSGAEGEEVEQLLLDVTYGQMAVELILSKELMLNLNQERIDGTDGSLYFLDLEIAKIREALGHSSAALNAYLPFLNDSLGVGPIDGNPAGRALFQKWVPERALEVGRDEAGVPVNESGDDLIESHKDLILIYDALLHHTRSLNELIYLLIASEDPANETEARQLIGDTKRFVFEQRVLLEALFPELEEVEGVTDPLRDRIGFSELSAGIDTALSDLTGFEQNLNGTVNLLGFEPDFLMLIQSTGSAFDSFDSFRAILEDESVSPSTGQKISRLGRAVQAKNDAADAIANYGRTQDALETEWTRLADNSIIPRLFDIVGVNPGDTGYETPEDNEGSEIWQQYQSIEVARLRIQRNKTEISNLRAKVAIEQQRRARESQLNSEIGDLVVDYGNQQAAITEQIGAIEAAQAAADNIADIFSPEKILTGAVVAGVINAAAQAGGELGKAYLEGDKEQLAAQEEAEIRGKENEILGANSAALIQTLLLEMKTLVIDSQEAATLLRQEGGRLTALYCEKAELERRLEEVAGQLSSRYFADPTHLLRTVAKTLEADIRFEDARRWLFFAARALEYKWNTALNEQSNLAPDGFWNVEDLFKMRNAEELARFFEGLLAWDGSSQRPNRSEAPEVDFFSLREDFFGYDLTDDTTGDIVLYDVENPDTGLIENVDAITAFRYELAKLIQECDDDSSLELCIPFDTVRQNDFQSNVQEFDGKLFDPLFYLDRLETVRIFLKGDHEKLGSSDSSNTIPVSLTYAGTSFIRTENGGSAGVDASRVIGELTSFPTRFYRSSGNGDRFLFEEGLTALAVKALKTSSTRDEEADFAVMPLEDPAGSQIFPEGIRLFRERSVATTQWLLNVRISEGADPDNDLDASELDDIILRIDHRSVQR